MTAILVLSFSMPLVEWNLITSFLDGGGATSHRMNFRVQPQEGIMKNLKGWLVLAIDGQYHAARWFAAPILALGLMAWWFNASRLLNRRLLLLAVGILLCSAVYQFFPLLRFELAESLPVLGAYQFHRFTFLNPLLWLVFAMLSVRAMGIKPKHLYAILVLQLALVFTSN